MRLTTVQDNNMQQMIHKCCVLLGIKFGLFDRGLRTTVLAIGTSTLPFLLLQRCLYRATRHHFVIKGSIELTHGSVSSDVRNVQSMDVIKYIYSNLLDISTSYFIKILSYRERERLDVDSQRTKKCTFHLDFRGERVARKQRKVNL